MHINSKGGLRKRLGGWCCLFRMITWQIRMTKKWNHSVIFFPPLDFNNTDRPWSDPWSWRDSLSQHHHYYGIRRNSALAPGAPPLFLLHCSWCLQGSFSHMLSFPIAALVQQFSTFLENVIPEACQSCHLAQFGWQRVCLGSCLCQIWRQFPASSHRSHPCSPFATKTWPLKPNKLYASREKASLPASRHQGQSIQALWAAAGLTVLTTTGKKLYRYHKSTNIYLLEC